MKGTWMLLVAALTSACGQDRTGDEAEPAPAAAAAPADTTGIPAGFQGLTDSEEQTLDQVSYRADGDRWVVRTGPAHIVHAQRDSAAGQYTVRARFEQMEAPQHPEAFGIIFGGRNLQDRASQQYSYFLVRGTGHYSVRVREGAAAPRAVVNWTASEAVPRQGEDGRATYDLAVRVATDSVRFLVNERQVGAVARRAVPTEGIAGLRINHNLHLTTGPVRLER